MKFLTLLLSATLFLVAPEAYSRDTAHNFSIQDALQSSDFKEKLDPSIRLYFGKQGHSKVKHSYGNVSTNKKTNAFNKKDEEACRWVLLSALISLQQRAKKDGGNAVINITSNYKKKKMSSTSEYECHAGNILAGVALTGDIVILAK
ncbi:hypothetical protein [Neptunomonas antarctica]|uniref:Excinuclease ATPase subunit n=1 Tax=Neptunomonas antarctica TaxID=619304 RepID=A0A1N7IT98_9GAMM|nr:hypothetical protein [Neptunomonas antarctica]SIS40313.1 hypothetical protein SAMN05421760_101100 [Neptunomonas antarctica]